ncbi:MAG TPA: hypothetical protein VEM93_06450, partial [Actinomycetota bacterium]|nr:hypothetical protein [Actinomycetota bacterium]
MGTAGSLALLALVVDPGPAISSAEALAADVPGTLTVQGAGEAEMPAPQTADAPIPGCTFAIDAEGTGDPATQDTIP